MQIAYDHFTGAGARYKQQVVDFIREQGTTSVCEIGGGANPLLRDVQLAVHYAILDISAAELAKAPTGYTKIEADISASDFRCEQRFDMVFSKTLAEHVHDGERFHRNVFGLLKPGGFAMHFFPTVHALPFLANRLLPDQLGRITLPILAPRDPHREGKFPAYYQWCTGPTQRQIRRFMEIGFQVVRYTAYFGHGYYERIPGLRQLERIKTRWLLRYPVATLASYANVVLQKPFSTENSEDFVTQPVRRLRS